MFNSSNIKKHPTKHRETMEKTVSKRKIIEKRNESSFLNKRKHNCVIEQTRAIICATKMIIGNGLSLVKYNSLPFHIGRYINK